MAKGQRIHQLLLGNFVGTPFDADDGIGRATDHDFKVGIIELGRGRIGDKLAVDAPDSYGPHRASKGNVGDAQGGRGPD